MGHGPPPPSHRARFLHLDSYRIDREWKRYEGTPQRELFRELRSRFLDRHRSDGPWVLDLGAGPGRFSSRIGGPASRRVLLDMSRGMLLEAARRLRLSTPSAAAPDLVVGDAARPPFKPGRFDQVVLLGNVIGFAEEESPKVLENGVALVRPGGTIVVETVVGAGERSRYLGRLPPGAVRRLLAAPINAVRPRVEREGFRPEPAVPREGRFRRMGEEEVQAEFARAGVELLESLSVAPALGADAERVAATRTEPISWLHLLELEEVLGRTPPRRARAAALLLAGRKRASQPAYKGDRQLPKRAIN